MDYDKLSDFEINRCVAMTLDSVEYDENGEPLYAIDCFLEDNDTDVVYVYWHDRDDEQDKKDYCNNFEDAWPIIEGNGMTLDINGTVYCNGESHSCEGKLLRAAMICFLKLDKDKV